MDVIAGLFQVYENQKKKEDKDRNKRRMTGCFGKGDEKKLEDDEAGKTTKAKEDPKKTTYDRSYYREKGSTGSKEEPLFDREDIIFQEDCLDSGYSCESNPPEEITLVQKTKRRNAPPKKSEPKKEERRFFGLFKRKKKIKKQCPVGCECLCHTEKTITSVAVDMALLTANANQLRILMVMYDLCGKIEWEQECFEREE